MRIGVMGVHYGHISGMFQSALSAPDAEFVGLVEPDDALYEQYTAEKKIARWHSLPEMLAKARPELVLEGLTHAEKTAVIEVCAAAGAHLLLDKPLCRTIDEWQQIKAAVDRSGIRLSMWYTSRSYPPFIALRDTILAGDLGEIVSLISTHPHKLTDKQPDWYFDPVLYSGTFVDLACHGIDQVRWLAGAEYDSVHALGSLKKHTGNRRLEMDHVQASYKLSNGALAMISADWLTPLQSPNFGDTRFIIMGTKGSAHLRAYAEDHLLVVTDEKGASEPELPPRRDNVFVQNLVKAITSGEQSFVSTADVLAAAQAGLVAQESARQGGKYLTIDSGQHR